MEQHPETKSGNEQEKDRHKKWIINKKNIDHCKISFIAIVSNGIDTATARCENLNGIHSIYPTSFMLLHAKIMKSMIFIRFYRSEYQNRVLLSFPHVILTIRACVLCGRKCVSQNLQFMRKFIQHKYMCKIHVPVFNMNDYEQFMVKIECGKIPQRQKLNGSFI